MLRWAETHDTKRTIINGVEPIRMKAGKQLQDALALGMVAVLWLSFTWRAVASAEAVPDITSNTALDRGFLGLYNLDFAGAQKDFTAWEKLHPDDPVGPVSEAAGFLFSEFNRLGVLESQFFESDDAFSARSKLSPDPAVHDRFQGALDRAQQLARTRLSKDAKDKDALFAMALASGLQADYAALIEKKNLASLHF